MLRTLGRMLGKLRSTADDFRKQFDEAVKEAGGEDLQREVRSLKQNNPLNSIRKSIEDVGRDTMRDKPAKLKAPDPDVSDDDLGPPPPLPPRDQSSAGAATPPPSGPSAEPPLASPASGEPKGGASPALDSEKSAVVPDNRLNGEHRPAG